MAGSVVFLLPNAVNPPATGDFWWAGVLEKYALSCAPYPLVGWLVMPGIRRRLAVEVCAALTAIAALLWPTLLGALRDQTADVLRRELGLPSSMLYVLALPGATTVVELVGGDYVAVTLARQSSEFDAEFAVLFADLRHPSSAQLVAIGLAGGPSPLE